MSPEEVDEVVQARTRLYDAQTRAKEIDNRKADGELIEVDDALAVCMDMGVELVAGADQLPGRVAPDCVGLPSEAEALRAVAKHANEFRERIAESVEGLSDRLADYCGRHSTPT